jgi:hypothetical protein
MDAGINGADLHEATAVKPLLFHSSFFYNNTCLISGNGTACNLGVRLKRLKDKPCGWYSPSCNRSTEPYPICISTIFYLDGSKAAISSLNSKSPLNIWSIPP